MFLLKNLGKSKSKRSCSVLFRNNEFGLAYIAKASKGIIFNEKLKLFLKI